MYDDVHGGMSMTTPGHDDGMWHFKLNTSNATLYDSHFACDEVGVYDDSYNPDNMQDKFYVDSQEANSEELLAYPDPLAHANEYHPASFNLNDEGVETGSEIPQTQANEGAVAISYTVSQDGGLMPAYNDVNEFPGVENGMLLDPSYLDEVTKAGEIQGTMHVKAEDEVRNESSVKNFLNEHGYTEVPSGYEVHHIVPLSQGGADDPHNMMLLTEEQHEAVTLAHRQYYGW